MSRDEILAKQPGPEMDALVAEIIFGVPDPDKRWSPSTDISAAFEVVDHMRGYDHKHLTWHEREKQWVFGLGKGTWGRWSAWASNPPEAICKAALLAVMDL